MKAVSPKDSGCDLIFFCEIEIRNKTFVEFRQNALRNKMQNIFLSCFLSLHAEDHDDTKTSFRFLFRFVLPLLVTKKKSHSVTCSRGFFFPR